MSEKRSKRMDLLMEFLELLSNSFIYMTTVFLLFNLLLVRKNKNVASYLILFLICSLITYIIDYRVEFSYIRTIIIIVSALIFFYKGTLSKKIMATLLLIQIATFIEFIHFIAIMLESPDIYRHLIDITFLVILLLVNHIRREKKKLMQYFDKKYGLVWLLISMNFFLFMSVMSSFEFSYQMKWIISGILIITSVINIYFCYYLEKTQKVFEEKLLITRQIEFQENKLAQNKAYLEKNNRLMHDIKKHYLEIENALTDNQLEYVKDYMKGVYQQYFANDGHGFTGNSVIDSTFYSLNDQCKKEGINLDYSITIDHQIDVNENDLAILLGSLFDNAINRAKVSAEKLIHVELRTKKNRVVLVIGNSRKEHLLPNTGLSKETLNHWQEEQLINRIIEKYSGVCEVNGNTMKIMLSTSEE